MTVKDKAISIALGTFLSSWEGNVIEVYYKLQNEDAEYFYEIDYCEVWQPFEDDSIIDVLENINSLINDIVNNFS